MWKRGRKVDSTRTKTILSPGSQAVVSGRSRVDVLQSCLGKWRGSRVHLGPRRQGHRKLYLSMASDRALRVSVKRALLEDEGDSSPIPRLTRGNHADV